MAGDDAGWDRFVREQPGSRSPHLLAWKTVIESTFGHQTHYLLSQGQDGEIDGVLPLVRLRSRLFGDFLVSVPFLNYGGPLASREETAHGLMRAAVGKAGELGVSHLEVRTETNTDYGLQVRSSKHSLRLGLPSSADRLWQGFSPKLRSQIKRAQREPVTVTIGGDGEMDGFYEVFARNMRDLGTPVYSRRFFESILRELPGSTWICSVRIGERPVAAGFLLGFGGTLEIPWASSLREFNRFSPNMLLYWAILQFACEHGFAVFDFGRSSPDSGPYRFKLQWGAEPVPLYWHYWVQGGGPLPDLTPRNPKLQLAVRVWRHLPLALTKLVGPAIVKNLP
jgi:FemAB-related protein (PEP-CTERM system-associated)